MGSKNERKRAFQIAHQARGIGTSKCGTGTKNPLPLLSLWVPVPVSVVLLPKCYYF